MSRVAKNPVVLPKNVECKIDGLNIHVKGPKGTLNYQCHKLVSVVQEDDNESGSGTKILKFIPRDSSAVANANAGTTRALVHNMVVGVTQGFERQLELVGVGYRAQMKGKILNLSLGFSHPVDYPIPEGITVETPTNTQIILKGCDKQKLGQVAAEIRQYRAPEPYKGKGIRYAGERILLKETKKK